MSSPLLRFEDGKIVIGGKEILVSSAVLSTKTSLAKERVYGARDPKTLGPSVNFIGYRPLSGVQGSLSIKFFISANTMSTNNLDAFLQLGRVAMNRQAAKDISEFPINDNLVGRYKFNNMYLKSFSFEMKPFSLISANATYDIYGTVEATADRLLSLRDVDFAHSIKSFGSVKISGGEIDSVFDYGFEMLSLRYNILVNRKISNRIRENENTDVAKHAGGAVPSRVSVENIEAAAEIVGSELVDNLNAYGSQQRSSQSDNLQDSGFNVFMYSMNGIKIGNFSLSGKIMDQKISISKGATAVSTINMQEVIR